MAKNKAVGVELNRANQDIILRDGGNLNQCNLVNFQYILRTGRIPQYEPGGATLQSGEFVASQFIDRYSDDAFTTAMDQVRIRTFEHINSSAELRVLLEKPVWDREDRMLWEKEVSDQISWQLNKIKGLDTYRNFSDKERYQSTEERVTQLNGVEEDMHAGTTRIEFDCESMSIFEGCIAQQVDNAFLPNSAEEGNYRVASNYFYAEGWVNSSEYDDDIGGHAFIISSATGNIIEATADPNTYSNPYKINHDVDYNFDDFLDGRPFVSKSGMIYGLEYFGLDHAKAERGGIEAAQSIRQEVGFDAVHASEYPALKRCVEAFSHHVRDQDLGMQMERDQAGRIVDVDALNMSDPQTQNAIARMIERATEEQEGIADKNDWPSWLQSDEGNAKYANAKAHTAALDQAAQELDVLVYNIRDKNMADKTEELLDNHEAYREKENQYLHGTVNERGEMLVSGEAMQEDVKRLMVQMKVTCTRHESPEAMQRVEAAWDRYQESIEGINAFEAYSMDEISDQAGRLVETMKDIAEADLFIAIHDEAGLASNFNRAAVKEPGLQKRFVSADQSIEEVEAAAVALNNKAEDYGLAKSASVEMGFGK